MFPNALGQMSNPTESKETLFPHATRDRLARTNEERVPTTSLCAFRNTWQATPDTFWGMAVGRPLPSRKHVPRRSIRDLPRSSACRVPRPCRCSAGQVAHIRQPSEIQLPARCRQQLRWLWPTLVTSSAGVHSTSVAVFGQLPPAQVLRFRPEQKGGAPEGGLANGSDYVRKQRPTDASNATANKQTAEGLRRPRKKRPIIPGSELSDIHPPRTEANLFG